MCGIIAEFNTKNKKGKTESANQFIVDQYQNQHSRGTQGFGIIRIKNNSKVEIDRATEPTKFLIDLYLKQANMIIAHHRYPTSTDNKVAQTHPMIVENKILKYKYAVIHNGIIHNDRDLKSKHEELGFQYTTEYQVYAQNGTTTYAKWNDSEALAIELALFIENQIDKISVTNNAAFIVLQLNQKNEATKVFFGRNGAGSCLNMYKCKGKLQLSSEGEGDEVDVNKLHSFNVKDQKMKFTIKDINFEIPKPVVTTNPTPFSRPTNLSLPSTIHASTTPALSQTEFSDFTLQSKNQSIANNIEENDPILNPPTTERNYDKMESYYDSKYITNRAAEFRTSITGHDTQAIDTTLETELEAEAEKIAEIISDYKDTLYMQDIEDKESVKDFYVEQINRVMKAMEVMAKISNKVYREQQSIEEQEIEEYNSGFGTQYSGRQVGFRPKEEM